MTDWFLTVVSNFLGQQVKDLMKQNHISFGKAGSYIPINGLVHSTANGDIPVYRNSGCMIVIPCHPECIVAVTATLPLWGGRLACIPLKHDSESVGFIHEVSSGFAPRDLSADQIRKYLGIGSSFREVDNLSKTFQNKHHTESLAEALSSFHENHTKLKPIIHDENISYLLLLPLLNQNPQFQNDHPELHEKMIQAHKINKKLGYVIDVGGFAAFKEGLFLFCL